MSLTTSPSPGSLAMREIIEVCWQVRRHVGAVTAGLLALAIAGALLISPKYVSNATLLLMLGPEYTVRGNAEEPSAATNAMDADHIIASETAILQSGDLHRQVLKQIGLEAIYPAYVHPGPVARWIKSTRSAIAGLFSDASADDDTDPVDWALPEFEAHLSLVASRQGNVITLSFGHEDPAMARRVLTTLVDDYLAFRRTLYSNDQSGVLASQLEDARARLDQASADLADFRVQNTIANYPLRLEILQHEQGDTENDANEAESQAAQNQARITLLSSQLSRLPETVSSGNDVDVDQRLTPLRTTLDTLRAKRAEASATYLADSPLMRQLRDQIRQREAELAAGQRDRTPSATHTVLNIVHQNAQSDLVKAYSDLQAAQARANADRQQSVGIAGQIANLQQANRRLEELERQRDVRDESYRSSVKLLDARRTSEEIDARKLPSVRLAQAPDFPLKPKPTRLIILAVGIFASIAAVFGVPLAVNFFRRSYMFRESLERDLDLPVLACVPRVIEFSSAGRSRTTLAT